MRVIIITVCLLVTIVGLAIPAFATVSYGPDIIQGTKGILTIDSDEGRLYNGSKYAFFEADGMDYKFIVKPGFSLNYAYMYFGDGTGQFVSAGTNYTHVTGLHANFTPSLVMVFNDGSYEEILAPEVWEIFDVDVTVLSRPSTFTPPTTTSTTVNTVLANNGTTVGTLGSVVCICGHNTDNCGASSNTSLPDECAHNSEGGCQDEDSSSCPK